MRKLVLVAMTFMALSFAACGNNAQGTTEENDSVITDSIAQVDSITTDSIAE